jgi:hypothetical protein
MMVNTILLQTKSPRGEDRAMSHKEGHIAKVNFFCALARIGPKKYDNHMTHQWRFDGLIGIYPIGQQFNMYVSKKQWKQPMLRTNPMEEYEHGQSRETCIVQTR